MKIGRTTVFVTSLGLALVAHLAPLVEIARAAEPVRLTLHTRDAVSRDARGPDAGWPSVATSARRAFVSALGSGDGMIDVAIVGSGGAEGVVAGRSRTLKQRVAQGDGDIAELDLLDLVRESSIYAVAELPFLAFGFDEGDRLGDVARPAIEARLAEDGLKLLYVVQGLPRVVASSRAPTTVGDLKGASWAGANASFAAGASSGAAMARAAELAGANWRGSGSAAGDGSLIWWGTLEEILAEEKLAAASVASPARAIVDLRHGRSLQVVVMRQEAFDAMIEAAKSRIAEAAATAELAGRAAARDRHAALLRLVAERGGTAAPPDPRFVMELRALGRQLAREWAIGAGADGFALLARF